MPLAKTSIAPARRLVDPVEFIIILMSALPRELINATVDAAIDLLDQMDGDQDRECNGDELDTGNAEDEEYAPPIWSIHKGQTIIECRSRSLSRIITGA